MNKTTDTNFISPRNFIFTIVKLIYFILFYLYLFYLQSKLRLNSYSARIRVSRYY